MLLFYLITRHKLDYLLLRFDRVYVGFPDFRFEINGFIVFFENFGVFSYMMALLPLISMMYESEEDTKKQGSTYFPLKIVLESHPLKKESIEEDKKEVKKYSALEMALARNYLMVLLTFELIHNGLTGYLVVYFPKAFPISFPQEAACRILIWYIYLLILGFLFAIAKV